jgi:hypothetical protein
MFRMTVLSLLLGAVATIAGLYLFYGPPPAAGKLPAIAWNAATAHIESGTGTPAGQHLHLQLNDTGQAIIALPMPRVTSGHYPFLHLSFAGATENLTLIILWRTAQTGNEILEYRFRFNSRETLWLATHQFTGWQGDITSLGLVVQGQPGQGVIVKDISLLPPTLATQLKTISLGWTSFSPWNHLSINHHKGVRLGSSSFYPVPFIMAFCALSLLAHGLLFLLLRRKARFDWRVVAAIFLICWISLDLIWQGKLLRQLGETYESFSGKDTPGKLAAGLDSELVELMAVVKGRLESTDSRIFVGSKDDYLGMRGAYYLYPFNVFWQRHGPELPPGKYLHSGDYIVLVGPTQISFDPATNTLQAPQSIALSVEPIISRRMGSLFRVK